MLATGELARGDFAGVKAVSRSGLAQVGRREQPSTSPATGSLLL